MFLKLSLELKKKTQMTSQNVAVYVNIALWVLFIVTKIFHPEVKVRLCEGCSPT